MFNLTRRNALKGLPVAAAAIAAPAALAHSHQTQRDSIDREISYHIEQIKLLAMKRDPTIVAWRVTIPEAKSRMAGGITLSPVRVRCRFTGPGIYEVEYYGRCDVSAAKLPNGKAIFSVRPHREGSGVVMMDEVVFIDSLLSREV